MSNKTILLAALITLLLTASACGSVSDLIVRQPGPTATAVRNVLATVRPTFLSPTQSTATPRPALTMAPAAFPTQPAATAAVPIYEPTQLPTTGFCCLYFAAGPNAQVADTFPAGTEIIYAIWDYTGLLPDDRIRRIWIRDDLIWLTREEKWDWEKYGASGTVRDLSIFDFEGDGLQPATYRLQLYLNDILQSEGTFVILPP
jgi:hypothetical protein